MLQILRKILLLSLWTTWTDIKKMIKVADVMCDLLSSDFFVLFLYFLDPVR